MPPKPKNVGLPEVARRSFVQIVFFRFDHITWHWARAMASMTVVLRRAALLNQVRPFPSQHLS